MADTGIFCTTAEILRKAGLYASSTSTAEAYTNDYVAQAEGYINLVTNYDYTTNYASVSANKKAVLKRAASCLAAIDCLSYNLTGTNLSVLQLQVNILSDEADEAIKVLKERSK